MKCSIPEISWHNRDPVLSVDIQTHKDLPYLRLATGGTDCHVLIWLISIDKGGNASLECAADLSRHIKPVNCVRFSPSGGLLASGDDEASIIVWKMKTGSDPLEFPSGEEETFKEQWITVKILRGHIQDVYDLSWSADSKYLLSGSVDNSAILWDVSSGAKLAIMSEHKGFVQGVAIDPCGQYLATISSDRVCRIYNSASRRVIARLYKGFLPGAQPDAKPSHFFHDDTLKSFFRRLSFSPDGELLVIPSGLVEIPDKKPSNATIVVSRRCLNKPIMYLPSLSQYSVAVRWCPVYFTLRPMEASPLFDLPYRLVFAVATQSNVVLYDTQHAAPFAFITKIHYTRLTDLTWSSDGRVLVVSSTDGYCSVITFAENELGTIFSKEKKPTSEMPVQKEKSVQMPNSLTSTPKNKVETNLSISEDANMPLDKEEENEKCPKETEKPNKSAMEVDDFELVYEGTVNESLLESKVSSKAEQIIELSIEKKESNIDDKPTELFAKPQQTTDSPKKINEAAKSVQQEGLTSPVSTASKVNVTPGSSKKKTPRRVQLITLSSPKSKKKLID